ncbi:MAG: MBL fold metallo-hydrolase [Desulfobacteraceae bacterium]|nr:MAG: MBL fold metallo-hydrolase [Desulfobacteraceae bacterium]
MNKMNITKDVFLIGDSDMSDSRDCSVYLINLGELVLIDTGAGSSVGTIIQNIEKLGLDPAKISTVILTHCHIDHVGGAEEFRKQFGSRIVMHDIDAAVVEKGDNRMTGAQWYGVHFAPLPVDGKLTKEEERLVVGNQEIVCLHTPGHTPGSICVYLDRGGKRILFGQDIHGPFFEEFGANIPHWRQSMQKLIALKADILCEGHFGVYQPNEKVTGYIERYFDEYGE